MWQEENQRLVLEKLSETLSATDNTYAEKLTTMFDKAGRIFISGAGRSRLVGNFLGMRLMHAGYDVAIVGEIVTPSVNRGDLLIVISGSGETEQLIAFTKGQKILVLRLCSSLREPSQPLVIWPMPCSKLENRNSIRR